MQPTPPEGRPAVTQEIALLGTGAASLATVDIVYAARQRIAPIYLLDATGELLLVALWALAWLTHGKSSAD